MENYFPDLQRKRLVDALLPSPSDPLGKFGAEPPAHWGKGINEMARYGFSYPAWGVPVQGWENYRQSQNVEDRRGLAPSEHPFIHPDKFQFDGPAPPERPTMFADDIEAFIKQNSGLFGLGGK